MKKGNYYFDNKKFYDRLNELRKARNCKTFKDFAKEMDIKEANISKWKTGTSSPRIETLTLICNKCGCDLDYLLGKTSTLHRENHSIHDETGLSEDAIERLRDYQDAKHSQHHMYSGSPLKDLVPAFVSKMITQEDQNTLYNGNTMEIILESLNRQRKTEEHLAQMPHAMKAFCLQTYASMMDAQGYADRNWYISWASNNFESAYPELKKEYPDKSKVDVFKVIESSFDIIHDNTIKRAERYNMAQKLIELMESFLDQQK